MHVFSILAYLKEVCPDHVPPVGPVPDVVIEHRGVHVAVGVLRVAVCSSTGAKPLLRAKQI